LNDRIDVSNANKDADGSVGKALGPFDLVEVAGLRIVDARPRQVAKVFAVLASRRFGAVGFGEDVGREVGTETIAKHSVMGAPLEISVHGQEGKLRIGADEQGL
jgi:hypothetical protein